MKGNNRNSSQYCINTLSLKSNHQNRNSKRTWHVTFISQWIDRQWSYFSHNLIKIMCTKAKLLYERRRRIRKREKKREKAKSAMVTPTLPVDHSSSLVDPKSSRPRWHFRFSLPPAAPGPSPWSIYTVIKVWCSLAHLSISVFTMITRVSLIQRGHLGPTASPPYGHFAKHSQHTIARQRKEYSGTRWLVVQERDRTTVAETRSIPCSGM